MAITLNGTTGIANVDGSAASPAFRNTDANSGVSGSADQVVISTAGSERLRLASAGQLGIGGANYGTDGYVLTSTGGSSAPAWEAVSGGLSEADNWRITSGFAGSVDPISSNLERVDGTLQPSTQLGSGMSVSSGVWTFPSTGYWHVSFYHTFWKDGSTRYIESYISSTADNGSNWDHRIGFAQTHITQSSGDTFGSQVASTLLDITDTSNQKIRFGTAAGSAVTTYGSTNDNQSSFIFMKLGDT